MSRPQMARKHRSGGAVGVRERTAQAAAPPPHAAAAGEWKAVAAKTAAAAMTTASSCSYHAQTRPKGEAVSMVDPRPHACPPPIALLRLTHDQPHSMQRPGPL